MGLEAGCVRARRERRIDGRQLRLDLAGPSVHEGDRLWEYAVLVTDVAYPLESIGRRTQRVARKPSPAGHGVTAGLRLNLPRPVPDQAVGAAGVQIQGLDSKAGTLDDVSGLDPKMHFWTASAQPWVRYTEDAVKFDKTPG